MTLRSEARHRRALAGHPAGTCISSWTLKSLLYFTSITLDSHLFLSHSHVFHLWVTWTSKVSSECFMIDLSVLGGQYLQSTNFLVSSKGFTSFGPVDFNSVLGGQYLQNTNFLVSRKGFTSFGPVDFNSMPLLSLCGLFPDTPWSFSFSGAHCVTNDWTKEAYTHVLVSHLVTCILCLLKHFTNFYLCYTIFMQLEFIGHRWINYVCFNIFKLK